MNNSSGQITTTTSTTPAPAATVIGKLYHRYQHQQDHELAIPELPMWFDRTIVESGDYSLNPEVQGVHKKDTTTALLLRAQALLNNEVECGKKVKRKSGGRHSSASSYKSYSSQSSLDEGKLVEQDKHQRSHREWRKTRAHDEDYNNINGVKFKG